MQTKQLTPIDRWVLRGIALVTCVYGLLLMKGLVQLVTYLTMYAWWDAVVVSIGITALVVLTTCVTGLLVYVAVERQS